MSNRRTVVSLRAEHDSRGSRYLDAWLDDAGNLQNVRGDGAVTDPSTASIEFLAWNCARVKTRT